MAHQSANKKPYLMLVTFGAPQFDGWTAEQFGAAADWPYDGVASWLVDAYNAEPVVRSQQLAKCVRSVGKDGGGRIWPWVFLNRIVAQDEKQRHVSSGAENYFNDINAVDLDDQAGALSDFLELWRLALVSAKETGAPGVALDLETYNDNYNTSKAYMIDEVAKQRGETTDSVVAKLETIGELMADAVAKEYPEAVIWAFFANLGSTVETGLCTHDFLCRGLLSGLKQLGTSAVLVDGGELPLGHHHPSPEAFDQAMDRFAERTASIAAEYPVHLLLGATLAPYHEPDRITGWAREMSENGGRVFNNAAEFLPVVKKIFEGCENVWIYGGQLAHYMPFDSKERTTNDAIHTMLTQALTDCD